MTEEIRCYTKDPRFIELYEFCVLDNHRNKFNIERFYFKMPKHVLSALGSMKSLLLSNLRKEFNKAIQNKIVESILDPKESHYINAIDCDDKFRFQKMLNLIRTLKPQNIMVSMRMKDEILDHTYDIDKFSGDLIMQENDIYKIGELYRINIFVNRNIKWNDTKVILFDNIYLNIGISDVYSSEDENNILTFVNYKVDSQLPESSVIYIIDDKSSKYYSDYVSVTRDKKIDNILK